MSLVPTQPWVAGNDPLPSTHLTWNSNNARTWADVPTLHRRYSRPHPALRGPGPEEPTRHGLWSDRWSGTAPLRPACPKRLPGEGGDALS